MVPKVLNKRLVGDLCARIRNPMMIWIMNETKNVSDENMSQNQKVLVERFLHMKSYIYCFSYLRKIRISINEYEILFVSISHARVRYVVLRERQLYAIELFRYFSGNSHIYIS